MIAIVDKVELNSLLYHKSRLVPGITQSAPLDRQEPHVTEHGLQLDESVIQFIFVGFVAQMVDGALGMAYGVISTTFLLSLGIPPVSASAAVHTAEVFTTGVSGLSHLRFGNVRSRMFLKLVVPGVIGGSVGAFVLTSVSGKNLVL